MGLGGPVYQVRHEPRAFPLLQEAQHISSTRSACTAVKSDGNVQGGAVGAGGDCSALRGQLAGKFQHLCSTSSAFAAVMSVGSMVTWGAVGAGGDSCAVQGQLAVDL